MGVEHPGARQRPHKYHRQDPIADYLATKYGVDQVAHLLLKIAVRIEQEGRPSDMDVIDRWLISAMPGLATPKPRVFSRLAVVYYIRFQDLVKIGTTVALTSRLNSIPHDEVLVTEPGHFELEKLRHEQFAHLRHRPRGEWFRYEPDLRAHVEELQARAAGRDRGRDRL